MYSSATPGTVFGPRDSKRSRNNGTGSSYSSEHGLTESESVLAGFHFMVARGGALLPAAGAGGRRDRLASALLGRNRSGLRIIVEGWLHRPGKFSQLFLPRRADDDCPVYLHLHHDVGDSGPQRGISALSDDGPRASLQHRAGQGAGWDDTLCHSRSALPDSCAFHWDPHWLRAVPAGRAYNIPGGFFAHRAGLCDSLEDGVTPGFPRHHQPVFASVVDALGCALPYQRRFEVDRLANEDQSPNLRPGCATTYLVS